MASLHLSILQPNEVLGEVCCLMLVHLCYATARLHFELVLSGSCFQLLHYHCHSCIQLVICSCRIITSASLLPPISTSSGPATLPSRAANTMNLLPVGCQGQGVPPSASTLLTFLFGRLSSAVDTGTRKSFYGNKGFHCHCSSCKSSSLTSWKKSWYKRCSKQER